MNRRAQIALEEADAWKGLGETPESTWSSDRDPSEPGPGQPPVRVTGRSASYADTIKRAQAAVRDAQRASAEARAVLAVQSKQQQSDELSRLAARIKGRSSVIVGTRQPVSGSSSISVAVNQAARAVDSALSFKTEELPPESPRASYVPQEYFPPEDFLPESPRAAYVPEPVHVEEYAVQDFNVIDVPFFAPVELRAEVVDLPPDYLKKQVAQDLDYPGRATSEEQAWVYEAGEKLKMLQQSAAEDRRVRGWGPIVSSEVPGSPLDAFYKLGQALEPYIGPSVAYSTAMSMGAKKEAASRIADAYRYGGDSAAAREASARAQGEIEKSAAIAEAFSGAKKFAISTQQAGEQVFQDIQQRITEFPERMRQAGQQIKSFAATEAVLPVSKYAVSNWDSALKYAASMFGFGELPVPTDEMVNSPKYRDRYVAEASKSDLRAFHRQIDPIVKFIGFARKHAGASSSEPPDPDKELITSYYLSMNDPYHPMGERLRYAGALATLLNSKVLSTGRAKTASIFSVFQDMYAWASQQ